LTQFLHDLSDGTKIILVIIVRWSGVLQVLLVVREMSVRKVIAVLLVCLDFKVGVVNREKQEGEVAAAPLELQARSEALVLLAGRVPLGPQGRLDYRECKDIWAIPVSIPVIVITVSTMKARH